MAAADGSGALDPAELAARKAELAAALAASGDGVADTVLVRQRQIKDEVVHAAAAAAAQQDAGGGGAPIRRRSSSHNAAQAGEAAAAAALAAKPQRSFHRDPLPPRAQQDPRHASFAGAGGVDDADEVASWEETWQLNQRDLERNIGILNEDAFLADVVNQGTNLQKYAVEKEAALRAKEESCIEEYTKCADDFARLYTDLTECEDMLASIRDVVGGFREHLGGITGDIAALQKRSAEINTRLKNRENAILHLLPILQKINMIDNEWLRGIEQLPVEAPDMADKRERERVQREIDTNFLAGVKQLDEKITFMTVHPQFPGSVLMEELMPKMMRCAGKLSQKVYTFILSKLESLRADTNIVIQQQTLAQKCGFTFAFLWQYSNSQAEAVLDHYADRMNGVFLKTVKKTHQEYASRPETKLVRPEIVVPGDTFNARKGTDNEQSPAGGAAGAKRNLLSGLKKIQTQAIPGAINKSLGISAQQRVHLPFTDRCRILAGVVPDSDQLIIDPSVLLTQARTYVEDFAQINAALINGSIHESSFISEFFPYPAAKRKETILRQIFERAFLYVKEKTYDCVASASGDVIGILLLLRISECFFTHLLPEKTRAAVQRDPDAKKSDLVLSRNADLHSNTTGAAIAARSQSREFRPPGFIVTYLKDVQARLWKLYEDVMGANIASVREANEICFAQVKVDGNARDYMQKAGVSNLTVHMTTKRYIELACDVHSVNTNAMVGSRVSGSSAGSVFFSNTIVEDLRTLRREVLKLIGALSRRYSSPTLMSVFAINNISSIFEVCRERDAAADEELEELEMALREHVEVFALKELQDDLGQMNIVNERYSKVVTAAETEEAFAANLARVKTEEIIAVVNAFYSNWRQSFAALQQLVGVYFQNLHTRQYVLGILLGKVVECNARLRTLVFNVWSDPPCRQRLVSKEVLMHEMNTKYLGQIA